jgi:hypothetical protein
MSPLFKLLPPLEVAVFRISRFIFGCLTFIFAQGSLQIFCQKKGDRFLSVCDPLSLVLLLLQHTDICPVLCDLSDQRRIHKKNQKLLNLS